MADRPNIIYILSDEHRGQAMTHAGDPNLRTPNMDRLAREGVSFTRAYTNSPICTPSRGTVFSGRHSHAGPVSSFFDAYKVCAPSTATVLREAGYHTAYFGKWHCGVVRDQVPKSFRSDRAVADGRNRGKTRTPENRRAGFQDWAAFEVINDPFKTVVYRGSDVEPERPEGFQTDVLTDMVLDYLEDYDREEPLFLVLSVEPPHFPLEVEEKWKRWDPQQLQVRPNFGILSDFFPTWTENPPETLREILANYYACVENLDWNIGRLMDRIEQTPRFADKTVSVYFSDHGDYVGSHGLETTKVQHHEESVRIPAIFHGPGIKAQGSREELFSLVDLFSTTLDLAGVPIPAYSQGVSFAPALRGQPFAGPDVVLLEMQGNPRWNLRFLDWRGIVTERWKYAFCETGREELFDLSNDPYELNNLAEIDTDQKETMKELLLKVLEETREPYFQILIEQGVVPEGPVLDVSDQSEDMPVVYWKGGLAGDSHIRPKAGP